MPFSQRMVRLAPAPGAARSAAAPLVVAGVLWLAAGLSMGYWVLQSVGRKPWEPVPALATSVPQADVATVARALGAAAKVPEAAAEPAPQSRYQLWGMVAQPALQGGAALIAVGDEPPRPIQVGDAVSEGLILQSVTDGIARLGPSRQGPTTLELNLPVAPPTSP
jgi:general secretion pathway protein C